MDLRYQNIESPDYDIRLSISGFVIAMTASASPWTENHRESSTDERDKAQIDTVLADFTEWVNQHSTELPEFDSAMLFTGLDLYTRDEKSGIRNYTKVGQATVGTVCQYHRTCIIEDRGRFESAFTGAHELGHNLGAKHDGENNDCLISDHYIMMPMSGRPDSLNYTNIYRFSSCSIEEIYKEVSDPSSECLLSLTSQYNQTAISTYLQELPGQRYDVHEQCKAAYGENSYYCGAQIYSGDICKSLVCHDPATGNCYILGDAPAAMGTTCGNKRWCYEGNCIYDDRAPAARDDCVFGDYGGLLVQNTKTCAQLVAEQPRMCYNEDSRGLCCASCADIRNSENSGCEYGDQADWCSVISRKDCYKNDHACCETCPVFKTGGPGCEYGDKANGCSLAACVLEENLPLCCATCGVSLGFPTPTTLSSTSTSTSDPSTTSTTPSPGGNSDETNFINKNNGADDVTEKTLSSDTKSVHSNTFKAFLKLMTLYIIVVFELSR